MRTILLSLVLLVAAPMAAMPQATSAPPDSTARFSPLRGDGGGREPLRRRISLDLRQVTVEEALRAVAREAAVGLTYDPGLPGLDRRATVRVDGVPAADAFLRVIRGSALELLVSTSGQTVLVRRRSDDADARGIIEGIVQDAEGTPVDNVRIQLVGTHLGVLSAADGRFKLPHVPAGHRMLRAVRLGFRAAELPVTVTGGSTEHVALRMDAAPTPLAQVVVTPGYFGVMEQPMATAQSLSRQQLETAPQLAEDTFRAVNRLPGVTSSDFTSAFRVRGSANEEVLMTLDGLQLYEPFHLKDFDAALSIIDIAALSGMELVTGGFGARYGDRLTGTFHMHTDELAQGDNRTTLALTLTNLRAATQGHFAADRGEWLLSARHGYIDYALQLVDPAFDVSPRYYDLLAKVQYRLGDRHDLSVHGLHAADRLSYRDDPQGEDLDELNTAYGSSYTWARWTARFSSMVEARTLLAAGHLSWRRRGSNVERFDGAQDVLIDDDREMSFAGLRQDWSVSFSERAMLSWSVDLRRLSSGYDYLRWQRRLFVDADTLAARRDTVQVVTAPEGTVMGAHVSQRLRPWRPLTLELGVRFDRHSYVDSDELSPRFNVALDVGERTTMRGAWGRYSQAQGIHQLQVQDGIQDFHHTEIAEHRVLGAEHLFASGVLLRAEAYQRKMANPRPQLLNLANELEPVPETEDDRLLYLPSSADVRGVELFARRESAERFDWSASYAYSVAEDVVDGQTIPRLFDQRHTVYADVAYTPSRRWRFSAAWQYHSGWPFTPITVRVDTAAGPVFITRRAFGELNSQRLPSYHRMDVRVMRTFDTRRGRVLAYIDIFNLYNRRNPRAREVNVISLSPVRVTEGVDRQLPRLPSFGVIWEF
ncbi:MAG TPA: TonB-dependent receptor [Gemmatimonadaceae bacterium]|nr:TonB-dependent receptor [Gemmatimonadaceae bacterium]